MLLKKTAGKWLICAAAAVACLLLWNPVSHAIFSVRIALSLEQIASGSSGQDFAVRQTRVSRRHQGRDYEALVYHPAKPANKAIVIAAGLSEQGCYHPQLVALSRFLAHQGFLVVAPDIQEFRKFQISADPVDQILFWHQQAPALDKAGRINVTGIAGISFSGTLALIAASRPEARDKVGFVVAVGPYADLPRCTRAWFAPSAGKAGDRYPTRFYAKWIIMRSALDMVSNTADRLYLERVIDSLLLQKEIPKPGSDMDPQGARWLNLATMREDESDPELAAQIERHLTPRLFAQIDPGDALDRIHCPVFLIHGAHDDLIPPEESMDLHRRISHSNLLIVPFLTHTHPTGKPLSRKEKAKSAIESLLFCYKFSQAVHP